MREETIPAEDRVPRAWLLFGALLVALPFGIVLAGLSPPDLGRGAIVHRLLEWSNVLAALFTLVFAALYLQVRRESLVGVVALVSWSSLLWGGMHLVASLDLLDPASHPYSPAFIERTWAIARILEASILGAGAAAILLRARGATPFGWRPLLACGAMVAAGAVWFAVDSSRWSLSPSPLWNVLPALFFVLDAGVLYPLVLHRAPSLLTKAIFLGVIADALASVQWVSGAAGLDGREMFTAHALELTGSLLLLSGLFLQLMRAYVRERSASESMEKVVSDLKRAEDDLRSKEILLEQLTSSIKEVFWIASGDGTRMHYVSSAYEEIFGLRCEDLYRDSGAFLEVVHPDHRGAMANLLIQEVKTEFETDYRILRPDGEVRWLRTRGFPIRDERGAVYRVAGLTEDVTERRTSEEELRRSEARHRALLRAMPDIMFRMSRSGVFLDYHARPAASLYRPPSAFLGARAQDVLPEAIGEFFISRIQETIATGVVQSYEYRLECRGRPGYFEARFAPSSDDEVLVVVRDVTEQRQLEKELLEVSNRERERIGHDLHDGLSQQLTGIALLCKVLQQQLDARALSPEAERARQVEALVEDALSQTKSLARGLAPVELDAGGLTAALQDLAHGVESLHGVRCHCRADQDVIVAGRADALHLYRIAQEAVSNALKHAKPGRISIELTRSPGRLRLAVEDDGRGIDDDSGSHKGMGLHIMRYRARMIDGNLSVRRVASGGTLVTCEWPDTHSSRDDSGERHVGAGVADVNVDHGDGDHEARGRVQNREPVLRRRGRNPRW